MMNFKKIMRSLESNPFDWPRRQALYQHIASQVANGVDLKTSLERFIPRLDRNGKSRALKNKRMILNILSNYDNGLSFADSLKGYIPNEEVAIIRSGEMSGRLPEALELLIESKTRVMRVTKAAQAAMVAPLLYVLIILGFLWVVGTMVVPDLTLALPKEKAVGSVWLLYTLSEAATSIWMLVPALLSIFAVIFIKYSLPRWRGKTRIKAERFLPYSFYRDINGFNWLTAFAALLRSGLTDTEALRFQMQDANPWLRERLSNTLAMIENGKSLSAAIISKIPNHPPFGFPNPNLCDDISSFDGFSDFPVKIMNRARQWATTLEEDTQAFAKRIGFAVEVALYVVMVFLIVASNELSVILSRLYG